MNILFLESHAVFAKQVSQEFLSTHQVTIVRSIAAARLAFSRGNYDLILADYDLDDGKGEVFVRECRASRPKLPIIAVSARDEGNAALVAAGAGAVCGKMDFNMIERVIDTVAHT